MTTTQPPGPGPVPGPLADSLSAVQPAPSGGPRTGLGSDRSAAGSRGAGFGGADSGGGGAGAGPGPDAAADGELEALHPDLLRYAAYLLGDGDRARDVVQDAWSRYWSQPPAERDGWPAGRRRAWLFTVCRHRVIDLRRKDCRMTTLPATTIDRPTAEDVGPARVAERREDHAAAMLHLAALPASQQEAIRLRFQGGLSYREIAEVTGQSVPHVGNTLHRALQSLRQKLTEAG